MLKPFAAILLGSSLLLAPAMAQAPVPARPGVAAPPSAEAVDANLTQLYGDPIPFKEFLTALQKAVADEDKKAVAGMVSYPFKTKVGGEDKTFEKEAALVKAYDEVFTPKIQLAIRDQTYATLFANDMGVMFGSGEVWINQVGEGDEKAVKIIGVNQ